MFGLRGGMGESDLRFEISEGGVTGVVRGLAGLKPHSLSGDLLIGKPGSAMFGLRGGVGRSDLRFEISEGGMAGVVRGLAGLVPRSLSGDLLIGKPTSEALGVLSPSGSREGIVSEATL